MDRQTTGQTGDCVPQALYALLFISVDTHPVTSKLLHPPQPLSSPCWKINGKFPTVAPEMQNDKKKVSLVDTFLHIVLK